MLQENSSLPVYTWMLKLTRGLQQFDTLLRLDRRFSLPNLTPTVFCGAGTSAPNTQRLSMRLWLTPFE
jgi:hypothetical protein